MIEDTPSGCVRLVEGTHIVAESPVWDDRRKVLFWTDIRASKLHAAPADGTRHRVWDMPDRLACLGLCRSGRLVLGLAGSVAFFDPESGALEELARPEPERPQNRLNDGKVGPDGAFWVGSMHERVPQEPVAALYRVTAQGEVTRVLDGIRVSNGLAWSPDGGTLYWADTSPGTVDAFDFDAATGRLSNQRRFAELDMETGLPDGGACDAEGFYWNAGVTAGVLNRFAPDGTLVRRVRVPVSDPTMPCFGGEGLKSLFVTSRTFRVPPEKLERLPWSGSVLRLDVGVAGAPVARFAD